MGQGVLPEGVRLDPTVSEFVAIMLLGRVRLGSNFRAEKTAEIDLVVRNRPPAVASQSDRCEYSGDRDELSDGNHLSTRHSMALCSEELCEVAGRSMEVTV